MQILMMILLIFVLAGAVSVTEAAVGTGIDSLLLFVTLKKIREVDHVIQSEKEKEEARHGQTT